MEANTEYAQMCTSWLAIRQDHAQRCSVKAPNKSRPSFCFVDSFLGSWTLNVTNSFPFCDAKLWCGIPSSAMTLT